MLFTRIFGEITSKTIEIPVSFIQNSDFHYLCKKFTFFLTFLYTQTGVFFTNLHIYIFFLLQYREGEFNIFII